MVKATLHQAYEIEDLTLSTFPKAAHRNHFFELIHIVAGTGRQCTNHNWFSYRPGNLFLLTPQDTTFFEITTPTRFFFLRFPGPYVPPATPGAPAGDARLDFMLQNASHRPGCILKNRTDKPLVALLVEHILRERAGQQLYHGQVVQQLVNALIALVARNIALKLPKQVKETTGEAVLDILHYIQQHIHEPQRLKAGAISGELGLSLSYLGRYFKKQTGESLHGYVTEYKLRLIETRLLNSDRRINELVDEFGFTDESHLNRLFKKHRGLSPSAFRKQGGASLAAARPR